MFCGNSIILINGKCPDDDNDFIKEIPVIGKRGIGDGTAASSADFLRSTKYMANVSCTITRLGCTFLDGTAGDKLLLGIYDDDGSGYPGDLLGITSEYTIVDSEAIDKGVDVILNLTSSVVLTKGNIYWLVFISESNNVAIYGTTSSLSTHCYVRSYTYDGSFPSTFPSGGTAWYGRHLFGLI